MSKEEIPMGAIENGRTYIERIEQEGYYCDAGTKIQADTDWQELRRCFETLADWAMHAAPAQQAGPSDAERAASRADALAQHGLTESDLAGAPLPLAPSDAAGCKIDMLSSRVCQCGTKSCTIDHPTPQQATIPSEPLQELHDLLYSAQRATGEPQAKAIGAARLVLHNLRATLPASEAVSNWGLSNDQLEKLRTNSLKPEEIAGAADVQHRRVVELLSWFARYADGHANPKWLKGHAFELAYYLATEGEDRGLDLQAIARASFLEGCSITPEERAMLGRIATRAQTRADAAPVLHHKTSDLVARFARALAEKLAAAEVKYGYTDGWLSPDWMDECRAKLLEHMEKGDPRDVAAYCAFLWHHGASTAAPKTDAKGSVGRDHYMSDAVLLRSLSRGASNISAAARAQLLAIADGMPKPMDINIICDWPKGMEERMETVWKDLIGRKPNYKLYDLQRVLAEFGYRMDVYKPEAKKGGPCD